MPCKLKPRAPFTGLLVAHVAQSGRQQTRIVYPTPHILRLFHHVGTPEYRRSKGGEPRLASSHCRLASDLPDLGKGIHPTSAHHSPQTPHMGSGEARHSDLLCGTWGFAICEPQHPTASLTNKPGRLPTSADRTCPLPASTRQSRLPSRLYLGFFHARDWPFITQQTPAAKSTLASRRPLRNRGGKHAMRARTR